MNIKECLDLLIIAYPHVGGDIEKKMLVYLTALKDLDEHLLSQAVQMHIAQSSYFPTIAELRKKVADLSAPDYDSAETAWAEVRVHLSGILDGDKVNKPVLKNKLAQTIAEKITWRTLYYNQTYWEKFFLTAYREAVEKEKERALLPPELRAAVERKDATELSNNIERLMRMLEAGNGEVEEPEEGD